MEPSLIVSATYIRHRYPGLMITNVVMILNHCFTVLFSCGKITIIWGVKKVLDEAVDKQKSNLFGRDCFMYYHNASSKKLLAKY